MDLAEFFLRHQGSSDVFQNDVEKVVVVILDKEHRPVERFVFEITQPPLLSIR